MATTKLHTMSETKEITQRPFKFLIEDVKVKERFEKMLGDNATAFLMSALNVVSNNNKLQEADPQSVLMACAVSATLNLPVDPNLSMAFIVPYAGKAQFQIGYKGLIELGHRSQQFLALNVTDVREGEYKGIDRMSGKMEFDWIQNNDERYALPEVGYLAYFKLVNGFEKSFYMTVSEIEKHAKKYSKSFNHKDGQWKKNKPGMSKKTVLKLLIDRWAPKSVEMRKAIQADQAVIGDWEGNKLKYPDNATTIDPEELIKEQEAKIRELLDDPTVVINENEKLLIEEKLKKGEFKSYPKAIEILLSAKKSK